MLICPWLSRSYCSDEILIRVEVFVIVAHGVPNHVIKIQLVAQEATNATESLAELESVWGLVSDKLDADTVVFIVDAKPVGELLTGDDFQVDTGFGIFEILGVLLLLSVQKENLLLVLHGVLDHIPHNLNILKQHHGLKSSKFHCFHGVFYTESDHTSIQCDLLEEFTNDLLLLDEFDIAKRVCREGDSLIESLVETIGDINCGDNVLLKTIVEVIRLLHDCFEVGTTGDDDTTH